MHRTVIALVSSLLLTILTTAKADLVKKTGSGICHPPTSSYFDRTKNFQRFH